MTQLPTSFELRNLSKAAHLRQNPIFQIKPTFGLREPYASSFDLFIASLEQLIEKIIPDHVAEEFKHAKDDFSLHAGFCKLAATLPLFKFTSCTEAPGAIAVIAITPSDYTSGVGRFIPDMLSRWALPGKQSLIVGGRALSFEFVHFKGHTFYFSESFIKVNDEKELAAITANLPPLIREIRINILAVYYARYIVSVKSLSLEQKTAMIEENISSLMDSPAKIKESNIHDEMQQFLIKLSAEEKLHQVKENLSHLIHTRPKTFDRDVFYEIRHFINLFRDKFSSLRSARHVSKVIAFQYLFKKMLKQSVQRSPEERHFSCKLLKTRIGPKSLPVLGILVSMNLLRETERFDRRHILESVRAFVPEAQFVKDSYITERSDEKIRSFYLEVEKTNGKDFAFEEMKILKKHLPKELQRRIENVLHPIFMPRNEEEIIRNIIILSKQLKYTRDIAQVIISYEKQTADELSFTVILVRIVNSQSRPLHELFRIAPPYLKLAFEETKIVGSLKRKYAKEANVFRIYLQKSPYFRKDFSVDLQKARQAIVYELGKILVEFRDYNGGMIVKQSEILEQIRELLSEKEKRNELLLENFFYSLRPAVMQSVLCPKMLRILFSLLEEGLEHDFTKNLYFYKAEIVEGKYLLAAICTPSSVFKDEVQNGINKLNIPSSDLTYSLIEALEISATCYIVRINGEGEAALVQANIESALQKANKNYIVEELAQND